MSRILILAVAGLLLTGCLVTMDSDGRLINHTWDEGDVSRLEVGQSNTDWVKTTFGDPVSSLSYADGKEVWKYRNRSEKDTEVGVFLLFTMDIEQERLETLSIEFQQGVVSNYWIEEARF